MRLSTQEIEVSVETSGDPHYRRFIQDQTGRPFTIDPTGRVKESKLIIFLGIRKIEKASIELEAHLVGANADRT